VTELRPGTPPNSAPDAVAALVEGIVTVDPLESAHRDQTLEWLASTSDVYRRVKPRTPDKHLVVYFIPIDQARERILLVDHRLADLWLPPGGHVEPAEHPSATVRREAQEELGLSDALPESEIPAFLTVTATKEDIPHTDVSLSYPLPRDSSEPLDWDRREFRSIRWWTPAEIADAPTSLFDPHLARFLAKTLPSPNGGDQAQ
jgi:8-oxo-dGTP diphosphatase